MSDLLPSANSRNSKISAAMIGNTNRLRHGHGRKGFESPTWISWQAMLARCRYLHRDKDRKHGARGIRVCERWQSYDLFLEDMGDRPAGMTLDRYPDNDGDYEPGNCRWATPVQQARNRRNSRLNFEQATEVAIARLSGESCKSIAQRFNISESLPREIAKGRTWKDALQVAKGILGV